MSRPTPNRSIAHFVASPFPALMRKERSFPMARQFGQFNLFRCSGHLISAARWARRSTQNRM
jgi:hypothetical protein